MFLAIVSYHAKTSMDNKLEASEDADLRRCSGWKSTLALCRWIYLLCIYQARLYFNILRTTLLT